MKLVKKNADGTMWVQAESAKESLYEEGEFIEFAYGDHEILFKKEKLYLIR